MIDKERWKIRTNCDKMEKLSNTSCISKSVFLKKKKLSRVTVKQSTVFFLWMIAFKTHLDLTGKFKWIGKMTYKLIK